MNINFKTHFPWPGADGKPEATFFREKILAGIRPQMAQMTQMKAAHSKTADVTDGALRPKLHTIRRINGKPRYREGMKLTFSTGSRFKPERFGEAMCTGTQLLRMWIETTPFLNQLELCCFLGSTSLTGVQQRALIANDGLTPAAFSKWFLLDLLTNGPGDYQVVHWTGLRY